MSKTHVIRIEREGHATRWVKRVARGTAAECVVTFEPAQARRMTPDTAQAHAQRLASTLRSHRFDVAVVPADGATGAAL